MSRAQRRQKARRAEVRDRKRVGGAGKRTTFRIAALIMIAVFVGGLGFWGVSSFLRGPLADRTVVTVVNGYEIQVKELTRRENVIKYLYGVKEITESLREYILEGLVDERLLVAEAERLSIAITEEELAPLAEQFEASLRAIYGSPLAITVQRFRLRVTADDLRAYQIGLLLSQEVYKEVVEGVTVTEADIRALYEEWKESLDESGLSLEEARDRLAEEALQKKRGEVYSAFLLELRERAEITTPG